MADEEVMVEATSPVPSDHHKRKLEDLELNALEPHTEIGSDPNTETVSDSVQNLTEQLRKRRLMLMGLNLNDLVWRIKLMDWHLKMVMRRR